MPEALRSAPPDARVSLAEAEAMLLRGVERWQDDRFGLKLGRTMRFGEGGAFDYAVQSASTVRESLNVAGRYSTLISDSLRIWSEPWRDHALIRILDEACWATPSADFAMSAFYNIHLADRLPAASHLECWFPYSQPASTSDYEVNFPGARLKFNAPFFGLAFDRAYEEAPMPAADPVLHPVHCQRVRSMLADVRQANPFLDRVRQLILQELREAGVAPAAEQIAVALRLSRRTLNRRLEEGGTTYAAQLDDVRRELGVLYIGQSETALIEVAYLLGFAHAESFHRAFKRWTGQTPQAYRARARRSAAGDDVPVPAHKIDVD